MPQGGSLTFRVARASELGGEQEYGVVITVSDTGAGMSSSVLDRAFDPFFSTKARGQGTGLGLSIVHGIVEQHGGRIAAHSTPGSGTTFRLFFPATEKALRPSFRPAKPAEGGLQGSERILVVDDDTAVLRLSVEVLEHYGYRVLSAGSLPQLTERLAAEVDEIEVLLTDVILPDMDGNQVFGQVAQRFPNIRCIFMTGHADEVLAPRGVLREHVELLRKPFLAEELLGKVRSVLDQPASRGSAPPTGTHGGTGRGPGPASDRGFERNIEGVRPGPPASSTD
jgi:two-component system cell cycle sensor histidine kinase/response regulator CckA